MANLKLESSDIRDSTDAKIGVCNTRIKRVGTKEAEMTGTDPGVKPVSCAFFLISRPVLAILEINQTQNSTAIR
jgi:hypothetical protein